MAQHDMVISNASGAAMRADVNTALAAIATTNSGTSAPDPTYPYQLWADTNAGLMKMRNGSNNGWVVLYALQWGGSISDGPLILRGNDPAMIQFQNYGGQVLAYVTNGGLYVGAGVTNFSGPITLRGNDSAPVQFQNSTGTLVAYVSSGGVYVGAGVSNFSGSLVLRGGDATKPVIIQNTSGAEIGSFAGATGIYTPASPASHLRYGTSAVASGTSVQFTGIPSWAKRITVMFSSVSTNGSSVVVVKIGTAAGGGGENDYAGFVSAILSNQVDPVDSYVKRGYTMRRNINSGGEFNASYYLATYPDLSPAYNTSTVHQHYLSNGIYEGRQGNSSGAFNSTYYVNTYDDFRSAKVEYYAAGFPVLGANPASVRHGSMTITNISDVTWSAVGNWGISEGGAVICGSTAGTKVMPGTVDRVVISTVNGTDVFDGGGINVAWE